MNERKADKLKMGTDHLFSSFFLIGLSSGACVPDGSPHSWLDYKKQWSCSQYSEPVWPSSKTLG